MDPNEAFIQGYWEPSAEDIALANQVTGVPLRGAVHVFERWMFEAGHFRYEFDNMYTQRSLIGLYRLISNEGDKLVLELYNITGSEMVDDREIIIEINRAKDSIQIQMANYTRAED
jgi:hypothetical protein